MARAVQTAQKTRQPLPEPEPEAKTRQVVPKQGAQLVPADLQGMYDEDAGKGRENVTGRDLAIPFLVLLQSNSPQCKKSNAKYIPGAEEGKILNTLTNKIYDDLWVIPCFFEKVQIEWRPRDDQGGGGGLVAVHPFDTPLLKRCHVEKDDKTGRVSIITPDGNLLVETAQFYVMTEDGQAVMAMASTQHKKSRKWNSLMGGIQLVRKDGTKFNPPTFSHRYQVSTEGEGGGDVTWVGWKIDLLGPLTDAEEYGFARTFYEMASNGQVSTRLQDLGAQGIDVGEGEDGPKVEAGDPGPKTHY